MKKSLAAYYEARKRRKRNQVEPLPPVDGSTLVAEAGTDTFAPLRGFISEAFAPTIGAPPMGSLDNGGSISGYEVGCFLYQSAFDLTYAYFMDPNATELGTATFYVNGVPYTPDGGGVTSGFYVVQFTGANLFTFDAGQSYVMRIE